MQPKPHHSFLAVVVETRPNQPGPSPIQTATAERLADAISADLVAVLPEAAAARLLMAAGLFAPGDLLRFGFPAWTALSRIDRQRPFAAEIIALGARHGRYSEAALTPGDDPRGALRCLPMLLSAPGDRGRALAGLAEQRLFENASLRPPSLSILAQDCAIEAVHGQIMTRADLLALTRMQLAAGRLDPFWPPLEHALIAPGKNQAWDLPAGLRARWSARTRRLQLDFQILDSAAQDLAEYALWVRAFRQLCALAEYHHTELDIQVPEGCRADATMRWLVSPGEPVDSFDCVERLVYPGVGVLRYRVIEDGKVLDYYPLQPGAPAVLEAALRQRGLPEPAECTQPAERPSALC